MKSVPIIFKYRDYRSFLRDYYCYLKTVDPSYSYKMFSQLAGLNSPNYLPLVISGERNLTVSNIHVFAQVIGLKETELSYFETLVLYNQASLECEKSYYLSRLKLLKSHAGPVPSRRFTSKPTELLGTWYYPIVLLYLHEREEQDAIAKIHEVLGLSREQISETINKLIKLNFVERCGDSFRLLQDQVVQHDRKGFNLLQKKFLRSQIELSLKEFDKQYDRGTAKFMSHAVTVPTNALQVVQDKLSAFFESLITQLDMEIDGKEYEVAQINVQTFQPSTLKDGGSASTFQH